MINVLCFGERCERSQRFLSQFFFYQFSYLICALEAVPFSQWVSGLLLFWQKCYMREKMLELITIFCFEICPYTPWRIEDFALERIPSFDLAPLIQNKNKPKIKIKPTKPPQNFPEWFNFSLIILIIIHINEYAFNALAKHVSFFCNYS